MPTTSADAPLAVAVTIGFGNCMNSPAHWLFSGKLAQFPGLHSAQAASIANVVSLAALIFDIVTLTAMTYRRRVGPVAAAWFIVCNKVYSPTCDIWLVVFFVLLPLSRRLWLAFCAVDLARVHRGVRLLPRPDRCGGPHGPAVPGDLTYRASRRVDLVGGVVARW